MPACRILRGSVNEAEKTHRWLLFLQGDRNAIAYRQDGRD